MHARSAQHRPLGDDLVFLDRNGIRITGSWLAVGGRRYAVQELGNLWSLPGPRNPLVGRALKAAAVVALVAGIAAPELDTLAAWVGVAVILLIPLLIALIALRLRPRPLTLWALYRGRNEQILESANPTWFYQVCRAIERAREFNGLC